jgi:integrase
MTAASLYTGVRPGEAHGWRVSDYRNEHGVLFLEVREQLTLARTDYPSKLSSPKTVWGRRKIPVHPVLRLRLDAWLEHGWQNHVGRKPEPDDFLFPDASGESFREERCDEFLADVRASGCETRVKGVLLDIYSIRHTFATAARRAGLSSDARDRLLGHRPKDTKAMHYEDEDLPLLAAELAKLPDLLSPSSAAVQLAAPRPAASENKRSPKTSPNPQAMVPVLVPCNLHGSGASSVSLMISAEEERFELPEGLHPRRFSK